MLNISFEGFDAAWARITQEMHDGKHNGLMDAELFELTRDQLMSGLREGFGKIEDYEPDAIQYNLLKSLNENVTYFSAFKTAHQMREANSLLFESDGSKRSYSKFQADILKLNDKYNKTYLKAEYNTTLSGGQAADKWVDIQKDKAIFPFLKYVTVGDANVRVEHQLLDGIIKAVDDPFWKKYYPPNDWQCRCTVQRLRNGSITNTEKLNLPSLKDQFDNNIGEVGYIFKPGHEYFNLNPKVAKAKFIKNLKGKFFTINGFSDRLTVGSDAIRHIISYQRKDLPFSILALDNLEELFKTAKNKTIHLEKNEIKRYDILEVIKFEAKIKSVDYLITFKNTRNAGIKLYHIGLKDKSRKE